jgi:diguanylate cyclase (GGDEF)-like protein
VGLLPLLAVAMEGGFGHDVPLPVVLLGSFALASRSGTSTRLQSAVVATGLLTCSALVVHICHGALEAHFHFFVMMGILALYEDWLPYGLGTAYVFVHHLTMGLLMPMAVFGHSGNALGMAAVHAGFITASGVANVALWRSNERARAGTAAALRRAEVNYEVTHVLAGAITLADALPRLLDLVGSRLGFDLAVFWTPEPDGRRLVATGSWAAGKRLAREVAAQLEGARMAPGAGVAGRAWATRAVAACDVLADDEYHLGRPFAARTAQNGAVALPVCSEGRVYAVLALTRAAEGRPDPETVALLESIGHQIGLFVDRMKRAEPAAALEHQAMTDPLTGLPNRRAWDLSLADHLAWATRTDRPLALAVIDFDAFKAYNDAHGHLAGDAVLAAAASRWRDALRPQDVLARYGGEEFVLLLPGCELSEAYEVAERLRARTPRGQTCSVGLAMREPGEGAEELVGRADAALYAAKAAGRARIAVSEELADLSPSR